MLIEIFRREADAFKICRAGAQSVDSRALLWWFMYISIYFLVSAMKSSSDKLVLLFTAVRAIKIRFWREISRREVFCQ